MILAEHDCEHPRLYFGSGNYYVLCRDCPASWVHRASVEADTKTDAAVSDAASSRVLPGDRVLS